MSGGDRSFTILIVLFVLGFVGLGAFHYEYNWLILRFPLLVGLVVCLLCAGNLVLGRRGAQTASEAVALAQHDAASASLTFRQALPAMIWSAAVVPAVFLLGYVIGLPLYIFVYLKTHGQGWLVSGLLSLTTLAVVYLGFVKALGVPLPVLPVGLA